jgi:hypothetical protein
MKPCWIKFSSKAFVFLPYGTNGGFLPVFARNAFVLGFLDDFTTRLVVRISSQDIALTHETGEKRGVNTLMSAGTSSTRGEQTFGLFCGVLGQLGFALQRFSPPVACFWSFWPARQAQCASS